MKMYLTGLEPYLPVQMIFMSDCLYIDFNYYFGINKQQLSAVYICVKVVSIVKYKVCTSLNWWKNFGNG